MYLTRLEIIDFRCFADAEIDPSLGMNLIFGDNGSGKTTLLEAVYLLGSGRSFRTRNCEEIIRDGRQQFLLRAQTGGEGGRITPVAVRRAQGISQFRRDGVTVRSASQLAEKIAVSLVTPDSHVDMQNLPKARRRWLDYTLFHVKPGYLQVWRRYMRALKHRNVLLRRHYTSELLVTWDQELATTGIELHRLRKDMASQLAGKSRPLLSDLFGESIRLEYSQGWAGDEDYLSALVRYRSMDKSLGSTRFGPHRADVSFSINGQPISGRLSRGQLKLWGFVLILAQAALIADTANTKPVILVDDVISDLDLNVREVLVEMMNRSGSQVFLTTLEPRSIPLNKSAVAKFHVKQGAIYRAA